MQKVEYSIHHSLNGTPSAPWNTSAVSLLLDHIRALGRDDELVGFELGNELFQPPHLPQETAAEDVNVFAGKTVYMFYIYVYMLYCILYI